MSSSPSTHKQEGAPPPLHRRSITIPPSASTVTVRLIDTGTHRTSQASDLFHPAIPGFTTVHLPSWIFLVSHLPSGKHILFDLGIRKDWKTGFPPVFTPELLAGFVIAGAHDVRDVLNAEHGLGISLQDIDSVIWSHHHFDHRGDITLFPASTELVLGPGVRGVYPTYPHDADGEIWEAEFDGREVRELRAEDFSMQIAGFACADWFGDGSLYVLRTEGHTVGHLSMLARVAAEVEGGEDMFVFMAGDVAHHPGVFRPSKYLPLPEKVEVGDNVYDGQEVLERLHPRKDATVPFLDVDEEPMCHDHKEAVESVKRLQALDADERILVCLAHDAALGEALPTFPDSMNRWLRESTETRAKMKWSFLRDFDLNQLDVSKSKTM